MPSAYETAERKMKADNFADETLAKLRLCEDIERKMKATTGKIPAIELLAQIVDDYRSRGILPPAAGTDAQQPQSPVILYPPAVHQAEGDAGPNAIERMLDDAIRLVRASEQDERMSETRGEDIKIKGHRDGAASVSVSIREPASCPMMLFDRIDPRAFKLIASVSIDRFSEDLCLGVSDLRGVSVYELRQEGISQWDAVAEPMLARQRVDLELWVVGNRLQATVNGHDAQLKRGFAMQRLEQPVFTIKLPASCSLTFERLYFLPIGAGR